MGSDKADFYSVKDSPLVTMTLREPDKLALARYLDFGESAIEVSEFNRLLHYVHFYKSREANLYKLKRLGSETGYQTWLLDRCDNLWSVLRNLKDRRGVDERYDTIIQFMREGFPLFDDLLIEQTGPNTVYGSFLEKRRREAIKASGVSDGHLQMLIVLTALFSEGRDRDSLFLFDEPETSLHPYALAVLAKAIDLATQSWNKQVFVATHSPVLLSQFDPKSILAVEFDKDGQTIMSRVSDIEGIKDLLKEYALGSLYMSEMVAAQSEFALQGMPNER